MRDPIVQQDFGGFNPRFPGVTVRLASNAALQLLQQSVTGRANAVSLTEISIASVLDHEVRHYHDALISPYSDAIFRLRVNAAMAGAQAISALKGLDGDLLPLPLATWLFMDETARRVQCAEWAELLDQAAARPVSVPVHVRETLFPRAEKPGLKRLTVADGAAAFAALTEAACRDYVTIGRLVEGADPSNELPELQPCNVYEFIALCVQLHSIWLSQGEAQTQTFIDHLSRSELFYARLWRRVYVVASRCTPRIEGYLEGVRRVLAVTRQMMAIGVWSIIGNYQTDGLAACPTVRLKLLLSHLLDDEAFDSQDFALDIAVTWQRWDEVIPPGTSSWKNTLTALRAQADRSLAGADEVVAKELVTGARKELANLIRAVKQRHVRDQHKVLDLLLADPESFVNPARYIQLPIGTVPFPMVRIEIDGGAIAVKDLHGTAYLPSSLFRYKGLEVANRLIMRRDVADFEEQRAIAEQFELIAMTCDMAFSALAVPWFMHNRLVNDLQHLTGKRPVFIV